MRMGLEVAGESIVAVMAEIRKWVLHFSFCKIVRDRTEKWKMKSEEQNDDYERKIQRKK